MQNIPVRTPLGRRIRDAFAGLFATRLDVDYASIEKRIVEHMGVDPYRTAFTPEACPCGEKAEDLSPCLLCGVVCCPKCRFGFGEAGEYMHVDCSAIKDLWSGG